MTSTAVEIKWRKDLLPDVNVISAVPEAIRDFHVSEHRWAAAVIFAIYLLILSSAGGGPGIDKMKMGAERSRHAMPLPPDVPIK